MKTAAVLAGRFASSAARVLGLGAGSTLPGLVAERLHPGLVGDLAHEIDEGTVVVTGTNGKTTTNRLIVAMLKRAGHPVVTNATGANLRRGIASSLIESHEVLDPDVHNDIGAFEVDEASMPRLTDLRPRVVVVTNFLRDQLDRYGEIDTVVRRVGESVKGRTDLTVVLNADDPRVASLAAYAEGRVVYYGLDDSSQARADLVTEIMPCPNCGHDLQFRVRYFGNSGIWHCPNCGLSRPPLDYAAENIETTPRGSSFALRTPDMVLKIQLGVPALYNVYNALAAAAACRELGLLGTQVAEATRDFTAAFGRLETLHHSGRDIVVLLTKNPVGASQAIDAVLLDEGPKQIAFVLNDNTADGRDISWTWDIDFERFDLSDCSFVTSGTRAWEMALRLKYAGVPPERLDVKREVSDAMDAIAERTPQGGSAYVLATYTGMIEVRNLLAKNGEGFQELGRLIKRGV